MPQASVVQEPTLSAAAHESAKPITPGFLIQFVHIRARNNGIPRKNGGICLAVKQRVDGQWNVALAQCPAAKAYNDTLATTVSGSRMRSGKYLVVPTLQALSELADSLAAKHSTGTFSVRVDVSHITVRG